MASQAITRIRNIKRALRIDLSKNANHELKCIINGRIKSFRVKKSLNFIDLIDGSTIDHLQVILKKDLLKKPEIGSYVTVRGNLVTSRWPQQDKEFHVDELISASRCCPEDYPLLTNEQETKDGWFRKDLSLRPRVQHFASMIRLRSELEISLHMIMQQMDFFKVQTPLLTSNDSEASSDLFLISRETKTNHGEVSSNTSDCEETPNDEIDNQPSESSYFGKDVYLTTSAQLHLESLAASLSRVYNISPAFRAENNQSPRHLCEFTMLEAEEAGAHQVGQLMDRVETIIKFATQYLSEISQHKRDLNILLERYSHGKIFDKLAYSPYIRMTYSDAVKILQSDKVQSYSSDLRSMKFGKDINRTHERILLEHCDNVPIFITDYPQTLKPFYMKLSNGDSDQKTVACFDLIAPLGGEICGGSLREDCLETLKDNLMRYGGDNNEELLKKFNWYIQLREFGSFPHGGFGLGIERLIKSLVGLKNIRDATVFPRWAGHCPM